MGREKARQLQNEDDWNTKALLEDYRCEIHGGLISYDERAVYSKTKRCAYCNHIQSKDD